MCLLTWRHLSSSFIHAKINGGQRLRIGGEVRQRPYRNDNGWPGVEKNISEPTVKIELNGSSSCDQAKRTGLGSK